MEDIEKWKYELIKEEHPDWPEEKLWVQASLDAQADKVITEGGEDVNVSDNKIIRAIIESVDRWIGEHLPDIYAKVEKFFTAILSRIGEWLTNVWEHIVNFFSEWDFS